MGQLRTGDVLFKPSGEPAVFRQNEASEGKIILDSDPQVVKGAIRNGYRNGLTVQEKQRFDEIMDEVRKHPEAEKRVEELNLKLESLKEDPKTNFNLSRYLQSEVAHIVNSNGIKPRFYKIEEYKVKP